VRGSRQHIWIYEDDSFAPLAQLSLQQGETEHEAQVHWYHNDVSGLPRELTGADGSVVWRAVYRAWGNTLRIEQAAVENAEPIYQPLRYQGQYFDAETGLHYNRFRYYDPDAGRFVSQDPIGLAGGVNLYQYAPNPLSWVDPLGLSKCDPDTSTKQGYHNETYAPKPVKPENAVDKWDEFLGPGPHSNNHPRTGLPDPDRIVSADGKRSIRYGNHEMNSKPTKHHYHEEIWTYDPVENVMNVDNSVVRVPLKK